MVSLAEFGLVSIFLDTWANRDIPHAELHIFVQEHVCGGPMEEQELHDVSANYFVPDTFML